VCSGRTWAWSAGSFNEGLYLMALGQLMGGGRLVIRLLFIVGYCLLSCTVRCQVLSVVKSRHIISMITL
jgi:hypothetical protein